MINKTILILFFITNLYSNELLDEIKNLYNNSNYSKACSKAGGLYSKYKNDEEFLSLYAASCLKADMVNRLVLPIIKLYKSKNSRENAVYFSTILYQKKLLYFALCDGIDISYIRLPKTDYILSKIFDKFVKGRYELENNSYWFNDDVDNEIKYKLSIETKSDIKKMYLRTYRNGKIVKVRIYW